MASYKYFKVTRKVQLDGDTPLTDWRIVGAATGDEAIEEFGRVSPPVITEYTFEEPTYAEFKSYWNEQSGG